MITERATQLWQGMVTAVRREPGFAGAWALAVAFALFVLARGKDLSWDVRNYHWYNPYALLSGRRGFDIAVAQHATFYNPMIDVPVYAGAQIMPAWLVGLSLGFVHGLNAVLLYMLAQRALDDRIAEPRRSGIALALAGAGMLGGMTLQLGGVLSQDLTVSLFVLASLVVLMRGSDSRAGQQDDLLRIGSAGLLGGIAVGLKLTMLPFAFGLAAGIAALPVPWRVRALRISALAAGGALGVFVFGGSWALVLWRETGNPIFPYLNDVFGSPLLLSESYRDLRFLPRGSLEALAYPFLFSLDGLRVADSWFRDVKLLLAYVAVPVAMIVWTSNRAPAERLFSSRAARLLFTFAAISYVVWLNVFAIYRYAVTLELLAPLLIAIAIDFIPVALRYRIWATALLLVLSIAAVGWEPIVGARPPWGERFVVVNVPPLAQPSDTMVLLAGTEPSSYVIPAFPPQIPFLRIDSWLDTPQSHTRFGDRMRARVRAHRGPLFAIFSPNEIERAKNAFAEYGLILEPSQCSALTTSAAEPLLWCALDRRALA